MTDMRRTLTFIHFASQLCGISPYGSFLRNGGYEKPVLCRKYLFYSFVFLVTISVAQLHFLICLYKDSTITSREEFRVSLRIMLIFVSCVFTTYLVTAITRLIGVRNFFKISLKLLSVGSFGNYHEGTAFSNTVIVLHFVLFVNYAFRYLTQCVISRHRIDFVYYFISALICETVNSFAAVQFLYFVFNLRRHFLLLNSSLNEVVLSTVKCDSKFPSNVRTVSDFLLRRYSAISDLRDILYRHVILCDILELINSSYSLQVLALIGSKFVHLTIFLYLLFFAFHLHSLLPVNSIVLLLPIITFEIIQLVTVMYCCTSTCFQVCDI
jgi:hypothetical protein